MTINPKYPIGHTVYLKTDPDQFARMVVGYEVRKNTLNYIVAFSSEGEKLVEDIELSDVKDQNKAIGI